MPELYTYLELPTFKAKAKASDLSQDLFRILAQKHLKITEMVFQKDTDFPEAFTIRLSDLLETFLPPVYDPALLQNYQRGYGLEDVLIHVTLDSEKKWISPDIIDLIPKVPGLNGENILFYLDHFIHDALFNLYEAWWYLTLDPIGDETRIHLEDGTIPQDLWSRLVETPLNLTSPILEGEFLS